MGQRWGHFNPDDKGIVEYRKCLTTVYVYSSIALVGSIIENTIWNNMNIVYNLCFHLKLVLQHFIYSTTKSSNQYLYRQEFLRVFCLVSLAIFLN